MSDRQYLFLSECLRRAKYRAYKIRSTFSYIVSDSIDVFRELIVKYHVENVWSHQETWNNWTYQRNIKLKKLFRQKKYPIVSTV